MKRTFLEEFAPAFMGLSASQFVLGAISIAAELGPKRAFIHFWIGFVVAIPAGLGFYRRRRKCKT